jgi:hypothetical protein
MNLKRLSGTEHGMDAETGATVTIYFRRTADPIEEVTVPEIPKRYALGSPIILVVEHHDAVRKMRWQASIMQTKIVLSGSAC